MTVDVEPLDAALGARIHGVDLSRAVDGPTREAIHAAWLAHQVLIFPGQDMSEADQIRFARLFGDLPDRRVLAETAGEGVGHRSVMVVTNARKDGRPVGALPEGEMYFHTDGAYDERPYRYTMLHALAVPSVGGHTLFADMYGAYETLPPATKDRIAGLRATHGFYAGRDVSAAFKKRLAVADDPSRATHPVVVAHEETGRPALYVSRMLTAAVEGLAEEESAALLDELFAHSERGALVYEHVWAVGDFVAWDNRCTNHARTDFPPEERRELRRTTVQGVRPRPAFRRPADTPAVPNR